MKGHLFIQRRKGKLLNLKKISSYYVDINGGENKHDRKLYAFDHDLLIADIYVTDMIIGADGIRLKGYEKEGENYYYQDWWVKIP